MLINTAKTKVTFITTNQNRTSLINDLPLHQNDDELNVITNDEVIGIIVDKCNITFIRYA